MPQEQAATEEEEEDFDSDTEVLVKGTKTLEEISESYNIVCLELVSYVEARSIDRWRIAM